MAINLHHLRLFVAVVDHGSFTKAANALHLSQPAISKSLNELERRLDVGLIDRNSRSVKLTEAGTMLYGRARELFGVERTAERELRELRGLKRGVLRVGATPTIATYLLPPVLSRLRLRHPGLRLRTTSAAKGAVLRMLLEFTVDVALVDGPVSHLRVDAQPWRDEELVVIAAADHPLAALSRVEVGALAGQSFLIQDRASVTRHMRRAFAEHGVRMGSAMRMRGGGTEAIKQGVAAGLGLAIVSRTAAADQLALKKIAVLAVHDLKMHHQLFQVRLRDRAATALVRELEWLLGQSDDISVADASGDVSGG